jgi:ABC-type glutathione transport system ATPase component
MKDFKLDKHTVILGSSGSGKTYFASWCLENAVVTPYAIFINTQNEIDVEKMCNVTVQNYDELEDFMMSHRKGKINYVVAKDLDTMLEQISEIQMLLFAIGDKINKNKIKQWVSVFFDEVQIMSGKGNKYNTVDEFFTRGRGFTNCSDTKSI